MSDQALKLFEALADVDEELLERCNRRRRQKNAMVCRRALKYGKTMAACVCLIVVGALSWGGYRLITDSYGNGNESAQALDTDQKELSGSSVSMSTAERGTEEIDIAAGADTAAAADSASPETSPDAAEPEIIQELMNGLEPELNGNREDSSNSHSDGMVSGSGMSEKETAGDTGDSGDPAENTEEKKTAEDAITDSRKEILWETACALEPFADYLPAAIPAGYEPLTARQSSMPDQWNNVIFKWSNGENFFYLNMTAGAAKTKEEIERSDGLYEYLAEEFRKELIPEPLNGMLLFILYYPDGMKIEFGGYITADEMWDIVESISK